MENLEYGNLKSKYEIKDIFKVFPDEKDTTIKNTIEFPLGRIPTSNISYYNNLKKIVVIGTALVTLIAACTPNIKAPNKPYWTQPTSTPSLLAIFPPSPSAQNEEIDYGKPIAENKYLRVEVSENIKVGGPGEVKRQENGELTYVDFATNSFTVRSTPTVQRLYSLPNRNIQLDNITLQGNEAYITPIGGKVIYKMELDTKRVSEIVSPGTNKFMEGNIIPIGNEAGNIIAAEHATGKIISLKTGEELTPAKKYITDMTVLPNGNIVSLHGLINTPSPVTLEIAQDIRSLHNTKSILLEDAISPRGIISNERWIVAEGVGFSTNGTTIDTEGSIHIIDHSNNTFSNKNILLPKKHASKGIALQKNTILVTYTDKTNPDINSSFHSVVLALDKVLEYLSANNLTTISISKLIEAGFALEISYDNRIVGGGENILTLGRSGSLQILNVLHK